MGGLVSTLSKPLSIVANPMIGLNALAGGKAAKALGINLEGEQGESVTPEQSQADRYKNFANDYGGQYSSMERDIQNGGLTKGLFGTGGLQEQLGKEQQDLSSRGYQLKPEDQEAYGQAAGNISRQFGQQEQDLSKTLARRGLGSAASGAAGAGFSGIAGNKNEMLARAQTDIAQKRMADTNQRLQQTRAQMQSLGNQGSQLANQKYGQLGGSLLNATNVEHGVNESNRQALQDKNDAYKPGLFETIGNGLQTGIGNLASSAPGMLVGGLGGAAATSNPLTQKNKYGVDGAGGTTSMSTDYLNMK